MQNKYGGHFSEKAGFEIKFSYAVKTIFEVELVIWSQHLQLMFSFCDEY